MTRPNKENQSDLFSDVQYNLKVPYWAIELPFLTLPTRHRFSCQLGDSAATDKAHVVATRWACGSWSTKQSSPFDLNSIFSFYLGTSSAYLPASGTVR